MQLRQDIERLAGQIGERHAAFHPALREAAAFIEEAFATTGKKPARQEFQAMGKQVANVELEIRGTRRPADIFVIGAHYDTVRGSPGANGNASGVAALLELARHFAARPGKRTLRLVAFVNEERPFTRTPLMGSHLYAARCRERIENITGMLSLDTLGFCSEEPGSQWLSFGGYLLPRQANFVAMIGNGPSRPLLERVQGIWQRRTPIPGKALTLPTNFPGARSSDHWSFWKANYPAVMLTDTARLRYPHYHKPTDTPDKIQYEWLETVVNGIAATARELIGGTDSPEDSR